MNVLADGIGSLDERASNAVLGAAPMRGILLSGFEEPEVDLFEGDEIVEIEGAAIDGGPLEGAEEIGREDPVEKFVVEVFAGGSLRGIMIVSFISISSGFVSDRFVSSTTFLV